MVGISEVRHWGGLRWHDTHTKFHDDRFRNSGNIKVITTAVWEAAMLVLLVTGIYEVCHWDGIRSNDTSRFMAIGWGIKTVRRIHVHTHRARWSQELAFIFSLLSLYWNKFWEELIACFLFTIIFKYGVDSAANRNEYQESFLGGGGKWRPAHEADNLAAWG
jgi:hypothetical protein